MDTTNPNRRQIVTGGTVIGAGVLVATATGATILTDPALVAAGVGDAAWDRALARFREVEAVHNALWYRQHQAEEAVDENTPDRVARYFDDYRLGMSMSRKDVELRLRAYNALRKKGLIDGAPTTEIDVARTADEFMAYQRQTIEVRERFQVNELRQAAEAHNPAFHAARDALMEVPAPTIAALLIKIEIAAISLDDDHAEAMLADARRLLSA